MQKSTLCSFPGFSFGSVTETYITDSLIYCLISAVDFINLIPLTISAIHINNNIAAIININISAAPYFWFIILYHLRIGLELKNFKHIAAPRNYPTLSKIRLYCR